MLMPEGDDMDLKKCACCMSLFKPSHSLQKYCRIKCRTKATNARYEDYIRAYRKAKRKPNIKRCTICGKTFEANRAWKTCSVNCSFKNKLRCTKKYLDGLPSRKRKINRHKCRRCKTPLTRKYLSARYCCTRCRWMYIRDLLRAKTPPRRCVVCDKLLRFHDNKTTCSVKCRTVCDAYREESIRKFRKEHRHEAAIVSVLHILTTEQGEPHDRRITQQA